MDQITHQSTHQTMHQTMHQNMHQNMQKSHAPNHAPNHALNHRLTCYGYLALLAFKQQGKLQHLLHNAGGLRSLSLQCNAM